MKKSTVTEAHLSAVLSCFTSKRSPVPTAEDIVILLSRSRTKETLSHAIVTKALDLLVQNGTLVSITGIRNDVRYIRIDRLRTKRGWYSNPATLLRILHPDYYTRAFEILADLLSTNSVCSLDETDFLVHIAERLNIPVALVVRIIMTAVTAGVLSLDDSNILSYSKRNNREQLTHGVILGRLLATEQLALRVPANGESVDHASAFLKLVALQRMQREESQMPVVNLKVSNNPRILAIGEMLLGHRLSDAGYVEQLLVWLKGLPVDQKPDVVMLSGLLLGEFKFTQKTMRPILVHGFSLLSEQIALAFDFLKRLDEACPDATVLVNTDKYYTGIVTSLTYSALFHLRRSKEGRSVESMLTNYKQLDKLQEQAEEWDFHYQFIYSVVLPFLIRSGRGLRGELQMERETGIATEEYFLLLDMYQRMITGQRVDMVEGINPDYLPLFTKLRKTYPLFTMIDNARVQLNYGKKQKLVIDVYNQMTLTEATIPGDPLAHPMRVYGQALNSLHELPNGVVLLGGHVPTSVVGNNIWFLSPSSPLASAEAYKQARRYSNISANPSHRLTHSTRVLTTAGSTMMRYYIDGSRSVTFTNRKWLDRVDVCPQRKFVVWIGDLQTGSPTGLLDVFAQALSYVFNYLAEQGEIYLVFGGDLIQGRNYPQFVTEAPYIPLSRMDDQVAIVDWMVRKSLLQVPDANMRSIRGVAAVPGNHEWNTAAGYGNLGALFTEFVLRPFAERNEWRGGITEINRYSYIARKGNNAFQHWMVTVDDFIPDVRFGFQHLPMERMKGAPGPGRSVMQYRALAEGVGMFLQSFDVFGTGHWHNPQHLMLGDTVGIIHPALAGVSGYEVIRAMGVSPLSQGISVMAFGGGEPFEWRIMTADALAGYPVKGYFANKNLGELGFVTPSDWNAKLHGMNGLPSDPRSAIQQAIWDQIHRIVTGSTNFARVADLR